MTALAADRQTAYRGIPRIKIFKVGDNKKLYKGGLVCLLTSSGYVQSGADTAGTECVGVGMETIDNTLSGHTAGGKSIRVMSGFECQFAAASMTQAMVGDIAEISDDNTVVDAAASTNHIKVGRIARFISATSVEVDIPVGGYVT